MTREGPLLILKLKGQRSMSNLEFELFTVSTRKLHFLLQTIIPYTCDYHDPKRPIFDFGFNTGQRSNLDFELFTVSARKLHCLLAYTYINQDPKTSINVGVKRSNVIFGLTTFYRSQGGPLLILGSSVKAKLGNFELPRGCIYLYTLFYAF